MAKQHFLIQQESAKVLCKNVMFKPLQCVTGFIYYMSFNGKSLFSYNSHDILQIILL